MSLPKTTCQPARAVAVSLVLTAFPLSCAGAATLFLSPDDGNFTPETNGAISFEFVIGTGWTVSNASEADVIATLTSPVVIASGASGDLELHHSYSFEYDGYPEAYSIIRFVCYRTAATGEARFQLGELEFFSQAVVVPNVQLSFTRLTQERIETTVRWPALAGKRYKVLRSRNLQDSTPISGEQQGNGLNASFIDTTLPSPAPKAVYYRVVEVN